MTGLPDDVVLVRTTALFDEETVPAGLRRAHRVASDVWGRIVVRAGTMRLVFEDEPAPAPRLAAGDTAVIPPERLHHVELGPGAAFVVEFHRRPADDGPIDPGGPTDVDDVSP